jgi:hypothetical protein
VVVTGKLGLLLSASVNNPVGSGLTEPSRSVNDLFFAIGPDGPPTDPQSSLGGEMVYAPHYSDTPIEFVSHHDSASVHELHEEGTLVTVYDWLLV